MLLDGIGKRYRIGGPWVLRDVRLELRPGRVVRIHGHNGSGKSTLLRVVAGIAEPSKGRVSGRPSTGYVPERFPPALPFTAAQYLRHHARMRGISASQGTQLLERFGAEQFAGTAMKELSKGTSQKIAVTQALLGDPELLVFDEAWTGLDVAAREELAAVVRERARGGACVVFVDHDAARLADATDERWVVRDGALHTADEKTPATASRMVITIAGAAGSSLAAHLPEAEISARHEGGHRIVVDERRSDESLRRLLALGPEVHIVAVSQAPPQIRATEES
ncbi:ABC transporter related [Catenulispora acidiphila DSM 44928]|uniref:ABC transporter related n=1 Tax=Catenulispora acidiphila (strain DSM 44928 / JCM 14897 / NBRC 102108 / NRRL B-24433 / ID139908) TaxID=479433 RepID=C7QCW8_CATAD|nr:ABC transporter ATP-binding protein [Catenulispora acidiphila]ACU70678.1 ABC transporter related [Catenulispora acidiphila DSM 44928]